MTSPHNSTTSCRRRLAALAVAIVLAVLAAAPSAPAGTASPQGAPVTPALTKPTGPYDIGRTTLHLIDDERRDPWMPDRVRELMATVTYSARHVERYPRSRWFSAALAESLEESLAAPPTNLAPGSVDLARARAHSRADAPAARPPGRRVRGWPVVLFSPGGGSFRAQNTALIEDLASRGYVVVSFDHTYETPVVEFPDGRLVSQLADFQSTDLKVLRVVFKRAIDARVADTRFVLDRLAELDRGRNPDAERRRLPHGLRGALDLRRLGMFGYSYGGYTAGETGATATTTCSTGPLRPIPRSSSCASEHDDRNTQPSYPPCHAIDIEDHGRIIGIDR